MGPGNTLKERLYHIIFLNDTKAGHRFDLLITCMIVLSVIVVILESVAQVRNSLGGILSILEWVFTVLFTIEYGLRLYSASSRKKYAVSFFGIVDFLSVIPSYLAFMFIGMHELLIIRILRLLRVFRIFEMGHFVREGAII